MLISRVMQQGRLQPGKMTHLGAEGLRGGPVVSVLEVDEGVEVEALGKAVPLLGGVGVLRVHRAQLGLLGLRGNNLALRLLLGRLGLEADLLDLLQPGGALGVGPVLLRHGAHRAIQGAMRTATEVVDRVGLDTLPQTILALQSHTSQRAATKPHPILRPG
eukprot:3821821-Rhodomonas_salina.5